MRVKDPTIYGLVETDKNSKILRFLEKPSWDEISCNTINAGIYIFEPELLKYIPPKVNYSVERGLFPFLVEKNKLSLNFYCEAIDDKEIKDVILTFTDIDKKLTTNYMMTQISGTNKHGIWLSSLTFKRKINQISYRMTAVDSKGQKVISKEQFFTPIMTKKQ